MMITEIVLYKIINILIYNYILLLILFIYNKPIKYSMCNGK